MGQIRSHWLRRHLSFLIHSIRDEWEEAKRKILKTRLGRSIVKYKSVSGPKEFSSWTIFFKYWHEAYISEVKCPEHLPIN